MAGSDGFSVADVIGWPKAILVFLVVIIAVSAPAFVAKTGIFNKIEPAWFSLVVGAVVALFSWAAMMLFLKNELDHKSMMSTVVVLGLISAHVCVFEISDELPRIQVYLLFGFVFYLHFTSLEMFQ